MYSLVIFEFHYPADGALLGMLYNFDKPRLAEFPESFRNPREILPKRLDLSPDKGRLGSKVPFIVRHREKGKG